MTKFIFLSISKEFLYNPRPITVPFSLLGSYFDQLDSQTILNKKGRKYDLELKSLIEKNNRYHQTVQLNY
jgi:hypothetical protein